MQMQEDYKNLVTEIIKKQSDILGPDMAIQKASGVSGLKLGRDGEVLQITGDPSIVLQDLVNQYIALSGEIVKNILNPVFAKYPDIKLNLK